MFGFGSKVSAALPSIVSQRYSALKNTGEGHYCIRPWAFAKATAHKSAYFLGYRGGRSLPLPFCHEEFALWVKDSWFREQVFRSTAGWVLVWESVGQSGVSAYWVRMWICALVHFSRQA